MKLNYIFLALFISSCASTPYTLKNNELIAYPKAAKLTPINLKDHLFQLLPVIDNRQEKLIGHSYTGVQYDKLPIQLEDSLEKVVGDYTKKALEKRGMTFVSASDIQMNLIIHKFKVEELIEHMKPERASCELELEFIIAKDSRTWTGKYVTTFLSAGDLSDGTQRLAPTMASCLNLLVENFVNDEKLIPFLDGGK